MTLKERKFRIRKDNSEQKGDYVRKSRFFGYFSKELAENTQGGLAIPRLLRYDRKKCSVPRDFKPAKVPGALRSI